jgi:Kef-type K+ transport system membrane component KefB/nucleotide-binding universal stress UspA family protein
MMKNYRYLLFYILTIGGFSLLMYLIVIKGETLSIERPADISHFSALSGLKHFKEATTQNLSNPLPILLLQIITIIAFARIFGFLCKKIGQPSVIGEIIAGIFLGPSLLGAFTPGVSHFLFPAGSLNSLNFFSQIGLILFMFIVGMDVDLKVLGKKAPEAFVVSHASIIIPFTLGIGLAYFIFKGFAPPGVTFLSFAMFIGISMSITAFPVLARILQERNLMKTRVGALAITCAAIDDISAWCLLAALIAIVKAGSFVSSIYTILLSIVYVIVMMKIIKPFLHRFGEIFTSKEGISKPVVAVFLITLLLSSYTTEIIGIHALFGAFIAGIIMPPNVNFRSILIEKIEDVALILLLPIFFVISGLRTEIGLLNTFYLWKITGWVILIAIAGKFVGSALSLRFVGEKWRESLIIGALMNTRGLMQLVALSIGYDLGVLSPEIYTIMIIMAIVTTLMTSPALNIINRFFPDKKYERRSQVQGLYRILISFGNPVNGRVMLTLVNNFIKKSAENAVITLFHLSPSYDLHKYNIDEYERDSFKPVLKEADKLGLKVKTVFKASEDIERDIIDTANSGNYDLIVAGKAHSLYEGTILGKTIQIIARITNPGRLYGTLKGTENLFSKSILDGQTRRLLKSVKTTTGIFVENGLSEIKIAVAPIYSADDSVVLKHAARLSQNSGAKIYVLDVYDQIRYSEELNGFFTELKSSDPDNIELVLSENISEIISKPHDLLLISLDGWHKYHRDRRVSYIPSALVIKP